LVDWEDIRFPKRVTERMLSCELIQLNTSFSFSQVGLRERVAFLKELASREGMDHRQLFHKIKEGSLKRGFS